MIDIVLLRDIMIVVVSAILSIAMILLVVGALMLYGKISRLIDAQHRSQEKVAGIIDVVEQNLTGIVGIAGLIMGIKKAYEAFSRSGQERSEEHGRES